MFLAIADEFYCKRNVVCELLRNSHKHSPVQRQRKPHVLCVVIPGILVVRHHNNVLGVSFPLLRLGVDAELMRYTVWICISTVQSQEQEDLVSTVWDHGRCDLKTMGVRAFT